MSGPGCGTCSADVVIVVELAAVVLLVFGVLLAEPLSRALAVARWPARDPVGALLVWQAVGLAGGLSLVGAGIVYGLAPLGPDLPAALRALAARPSAVLWLPLDHILALLAGLALAGWLLAVLAVTASRTLRVRRRHRDLLDVLATPWPAVPGARVLDHPVPVAYCLPGRRSRLVLSAGALDALDPVQVDAVLAHERAHLRERHDLVVLPFVAWGATAPFVRGMVCAQVAVAALIEMRADDVAAAAGCAGRAGRRAAGRRRGCARCRAQLVLRRTGSPARSDRRAPGAAADVGEGARPGDRRGAGRRADRGPVLLADHPRRVLNSGAAAEHGGDRQVSDPPGAVFRSWIGNPCLRRRDGRPRHREDGTPVSQDQLTPQDPRTRHESPGSGEKDVEYPGRTGDMDVQPDHGEKTYRGLGRLEGRKTVITGGDSGIGRAVALAFAREGADVLISYLPAEEDDARETVRLVEDAGRVALTAPGDLREEAQCRAVVERAVDEFGHIDVLVSNAAYQMARPSGLEEIPSEQFDRVMKTNVYALFWLAKAAVPHMRPGSSIISSTSVQAFSSVAAPAGLRHVQGRDRDVHQGAGREPRGEGHPGQRGRTRPGVDAADPGDLPGGQAGLVRAAGAAGPGRRSRWSSRRSMCSWRRRSPPT